MNYLFRYETQQGDIRPVPASPWLLPAAFVLGLINLFRFLFPRKPVTWRCAYPEKFDPVLYEEYKRLYNKLYAKRKKDPLAPWTGSDIYTRQLIGNPPWDEPGRNHQYPIDPSLF